MKEANCGTAPHRSANAWQFISITVFSRMDPLVLACTPVELAFTHGPRGTSLKENATRDNNKIGDGRERRGRLKKRRSKKKCISKCGITIFRACVPIQKIPAFSDVLAFFKLEIPSGGLSNLRLRDVEKQPLAKIKHA
jgi:hypothetical protein